MKKLFRNKKALSPVMATVILVSVTIVVAVSVAYWLGTIASSYTAFEQIELPTAYAKRDADLFIDDGGWNVTIELKNTGSADATIDNIFLNAMPIKDYTSGTIKLYDGSTPITLSSIDILVPKGESKTLLLQVRQYNSTVTEGPERGVEGCTSGTRIDIKIHSAAGREYPVQVKLP